VPTADTQIDAAGSIVGAGRVAPVSTPALAPHAALAGAAALAVVFESLGIDTGDAYWLLAAAACVAAALVFTWHRQSELRFAPVIAIAAAYHLAVVTAHIAGGVVADQDPVAYGIYGSELLDGRYPEAEYPAGAVLLFGLEAFVGHGSALVSNRLLMVPFELMCVAGIWGLHTRYSRWLAAALAIWPMSVFYWEYRFDLVPAGLLVVGLLLAYRRRWGWSGALLGLGAIVKWSPGVSFVFLAVWLVAGRRWRELRWFAASFVAVLLLVHVPLLLWNADHVLNPYADQGGRQTTNESVWYFPLRVLGLTSGGEDREWAPTGAPHEADLVVLAIQAALMAGLIAVAVSVRRSTSRGLAIAALAPALFLLTNRVFSPQFMVVVAAAILFACALTARNRAEQLLVGMLVLGAAFANAFVYPYARGLLDLSWTPASALVYLLALPAVAVVLRSTLAQRTLAGAAEPSSDVLPDFGMRDVAAAISTRNTDGDSTLPVVPAWTRRALAWATGSVSVLFFVPAVFVAVVLPYRYWDSLAFGSWSRSIAEGRGLWENASIFALSRPVVYVPQGLAWRYLDDGDWVGRLYSLSLAIALLVAVWLLAGRLSSWDTAAPVTRSISIGVLLGSAVFAGLVAAGMTDIPVAAGSAATAAVLWRAPNRWLLVLVAAVAAATVLAKASGLIALAGLAAAVLVLNGRRAVPGVVGMAVGVSVALVYDAWQASRIGRSLTDFLTAGNEQYWLDRGAAARWDALARAEWLGASVRLLILYGLVHGVARAVGARPRIALAVAAAVGLAWSIVGPLAADDGVPHPFDGSILGLVGWLVIVAAIGTAPFLANDDPIDRRVYLALLVWLAPTAVIWAWTRADEVRHLAPVWAPFVLLAAAALASVSFALAKLRPSAVVVPALAVLLLAVANIPSIDGLGRQGWRGLFDLGWSGWTNRADVENFAWGPFSYVVNLSRENVGESDRVVTSDGRLSYFFPGRVDVRYARTCGELEGARFFSFLSSGESLKLAQLGSQPTDPLGWLQCARPHLELVGQQPGIYAAFVVGGPPARAPTLADCHIAATEGQLTDAVFGNELTYAQASALVTRALGVGFEGSRIERTGCSTFRVLVTGVPDDPKVRADFREQAARVGFDVTYEPAVRYPEVPAGVSPVPP
jgi:Glycosyltransferase family 87